VKRCPRCDRGCQNKFERVCADCAAAELTPEERQRQLALLRLDPFTVAAAFADATDPREDTDR
jgi:hypothetical protein